MNIAFIVKGLIKNKISVISEIRQSFPAAEISETLRPYHAMELAKSAAENNFTHIIAVGGDGTLSEVVNGLMNSSNAAIPTVGLLSCGTANDFSKTAKLEGTLEHLKRIIKNNYSKKTDIGYIKYTDLNGKEAERYFINIADVGIGGYIVENINKSPKTLGPGMTYLMETLKAMFLYKRTRIRCESREFSWEGKTLSMVIANGKYFGSGLCIAPEAMLENGKLNIVILGNVTIPDYLKNLGKVKKGEKLIHPEVKYYQTEEIKIIPMEDKCPIDLDGEFIGYAPATFKIIPGKIPFLRD